MRRKILALLNVETRNDAVDRRNDTTLADAHLCLVDTGLCRVHVRPDGGKLGVGLVLGGARFGEPRLGLVIFLFGR